jgi:hypothetical protein
MFIQISYPAFSRANQPQHRCSIDLAACRAEAPAGARKQESLRHDQEIQDRCLAVFPAALAGAQAALAAQPWAELRPDRLRASMALHVGEAEARATVCRLGSAHCLGAD